ncbi:MAG: glycerophosphoryl diester phosphodiesterase membrane domain-containing protein, partial [Candidatus Thorarchaeota archaeon]|nr:glycerophosphoryl diester phosphodiesterase membrane domain-containing protein [Candidatus Thorarchaeota archaeon]
GAFVLTALINGAAIKFTLDEYGGIGGNIGSSFSHSLGRVVNVIIVQLILSFFAAIAIVPGTVLSNQALEMIDIIDPFNPIIPAGAFELMLAAMGLLAVGGLFLMYISVRFAPTLAIVIETDLSPIDSLKRSWELTSGNFLHVFGSYILLTVAVLILGLAATFGVSFILLPEDYLFVIDGVVTALLFSSLSFIFTAVLYRDLSSRAGTVSSSLDNLRVT